MTAIFACAQRLYRLPQQDSHQVQPLLSLARKRASVSMFPLQLRTLVHLCPWRKCHPAALVCNNFSTLLIPLCDCRQHGPEGPCCKTCPNVSPSTPAAGGMHWHQQLRQHLTFCSRWMQQSHQKLPKASQGLRVAGRPDKTTVYTHRPGLCALPLQQVHKGPCCCYAAALVRTPAVPRCCNSLGR